MSYDVAIVGGGVIGAAIAYELAANGVTTIVFDDPAALGKATAAATGLLLEGTRGPRDGRHASGLAASLAMYPAWVEELERQSGVHVGYKPGRVLRVALDAHEECRLRRWAEQQSSCDNGVRWLSAADVVQRELWLEGTVRGALWHASEATVEPGALLSALWLGSARGGVALVRSRVVRLSPIGRGWEIEAQERHVSASEVVLAAGYHTAELAAGLGVSLPLRPVRGTAYAVRPGFRSAHAVLARNLRLVPRPSGDLIVGSTVEPGVADPRIGTHELAELRARSEEFFPVLRGIPIVAVWTGIRPGTPVRHPIVARVPQRPGLVIATGHHRSGFALAPLTAKVVREILCGAPDTDAGRLFAWPAS